MIHRSATPASRSLASERDASTFRRRLTICLGAVLLVVAACDRDDNHLDLVAGGNADRGSAAIKRYGCGSCHTIPGIRGASGLVGPPLAGVASRVYVGGVLTNTPDHMIEWIENPKTWAPKTAMPDLGVTHGDAVNIASYLYTLK